MIELFVRTIADNNEIEIRSRLVWICILSAVGMYFGITNNIFVMFVLILNIMSLFVLNMHEIFCELMFLLPFTTIYKMSPASTSFFTYFSLITVVRFITKGHKIPRNILITILLFAVATFEGAEGTVTDFIKIISNILLFSVFVRTARRKMHANLILSLSYGEIVTSIIGLRKTTWPALSAFFDNMKEEYIGLEKIARFTGLYRDPNYYSIMISLCIFGVLLFVYLKEIKLLKGVSVFCALIVFGCMTYSRLFYLSLLALLCVFVIVRLKNRKYISTLFLVIGFSVAFLIVANKYGVIEKIMFRFGVDDVSNGRLELWRLYFDEIKNASLLKQLFGNGLEADLIKGYGSHNFWIECLYHLGIIGSILYFYSITSIIKARVQPFFKRRILNYSSLLVTMAMFTTLGMLFQFDFIYILMINWIYMNTDIKRNRLGYGECQ